ncbi:hypothetical protein GX408_17125 [bacterium]|nr:hypothetical protein [bacterium]
MWSSHGDLKASVRALKFLNEVSLHLDPRINIFIGANENGKTDLLKSIEAFRPDRSKGSGPHSRISGDEKSEHPHYPLCVYDQSRASGTGQPGDQRQQGHPGGGGMLSAEPETFAQ